MLLLKRNTWIRLLYRNLLYESWILNTYLNSTLVLKYSKCYFNLYPSILRHSMHFKWRILVTRVACIFIMILQKEYLHAFHKYCQVCYMFNVSTNQIYFETTNRKVMKNFATVIDLTTPTGRFYTVTLKRPTRGWWYIRAIFTATTSCRVLTSLVINRGSQELNLFCSRPHARPAVIYPYCSKTFFIPIPAFRAVMK